MPEVSHGRSLPWFRVDCDLIDHPKVMTLAAVWGVSEAQAGWFILNLWAWTMRYAPRGRLAPGAETALGRRAPVHPDTALMLRGLISAGWLEPLEGGGWVVHDWDEHNGAAVAKAEKDAERKRTARRRRGDGAETARAGRADGAGTERNGTERNVVKDTRLAEPPPSKPRRKPAEKPPDPRHAPLVAELDKAYTDVRGVKYPFTGRDAKAVSTLLGQAEPPVVVAAWRRALVHRGFPSVATLSELSTHLARFLTDAPPGRGPVESSDWSQETAFGEVPL